MERDNGVDAIFTKNTNNFGKIDKLRQFLVRPVVFFLRGTVSALAEKPSEDELPLHGVEEIKGCENNSDPKFTETQNNGSPAKIGRR